MVGKHSPDTPSDHQKGFDHQLNLVSWSSIVDTLLRLQVRLYGRAGHRGSGQQLPAAGGDGRLLAAPPRLPPRPLPKTLQRLHDPRPGALILFSFACLQDCFLCLLPA